MNQSKSLTGSDFYRFFQCPHWPYWERFGDESLRRPLTREEEKRLDDGLTHEKKIIENMYGVPEDLSVYLEDIDAGVNKTLDLMKAGVPVIYQGWLKDGDWVGHPDILERQPGKSYFGDWVYVPVDIKRAHELKKSHMCQLSFYATLLERAQGYFPRHPAIINGDGERLSFDASAFEYEFTNILEQLERIRAKELPDPVYRKSCHDTSPWGAACFKLASEQRDIALLYNVDVKKLKALRSLGVKTIDDAAVLNVDALEGQVNGLTRHALEAVRRQANALVHDAVTIRKAFIDPTVGLEIHFDIESYPQDDVDYLFGIWLPDGYKSFVAETPDQEKHMWKAFLAWTETLPEHYTVYHYANYELQRLSVLARRYGDTDNPHLERFRDSMIDLKEIVREHIVFPLYFYSLKSIAKFLDFQWMGEVKGGGDSILVYGNWLETQQRHLLESIIQYNREDVQATAHVLSWMRKYATNEVTYQQPFPWNI